MRNRVLVAVSFGPQSDAALKYGREIARHIHGIVSCLYVVEEPGFITRGLISKEMQQKIRREAERSLSSKVHSIFSSSPEASFEVMVTTGKVHHKILEKADELDARYIVMGRSDSIDLRKEWLGSNSRLVLARSNIPVCCVRNSASLQNNIVLLPLNLHRDVSIKLAKTLEMAVSFHWKVLLCSALPTLCRPKHALYKKRLQEIQKVMGVAGIPCTTQLIYSDQSVSEEIVVLAKSVKAGQIIMMTQQEEAEGEVFIGSNTRGVLKQSGLTVFSITPDIQIDHPSHKIMFDQLNTPVPMT